MISIGILVTLVGKFSTVTIKKQRSCGYKGNLGKRKQIGKFCNDGDVSHRQTDMTNLMIPFRNCFVTRA